MIKYITILIYCVLLIVTVGAVESEVGYIGYSGLPNVEESKQVLIFSFALIILVTRFMPAILKKPSDIAAWILFVCIYIPITILAPYFKSDQINWISDILINFALVSSMIFIGLLSRINIGVKKKQNNETEHIELNNKKAIKTLIITLGIICATILIYSALKTASTFSFENVLFDVYERRLKAREFFEGRQFLGYIIAWSMYTISPLLVWAGNEFSSKKMLTLALIIGLSLFIIDGTKSSIMIAIYTQFIIYYEKKFNKKPFLLAGLISLIILASIFEWKINQSPMISAFIVRRLITDTSLTFWIYNKIFENNLIWFTDSKLSILFGIDRGEDKSTILAQKMGGGDDENWNGSAYAEILGDTGIIGIILVTFIMVIILISLNQLAKNVQIKGLTVAYAGLYAYYWSQSAILTSLITYGIIPSTILIYIVSRIKFKKIRR